MRYKILMLVFVLSSFLNLKAQNDLELPNIIPPSPNAYELGKFGQIPVSEFTGTSSYSIPLYDYETRHFKVPITLNYNSSGIKVDQISSNIGLGWTLTAGGVITKIVRDVDDNHGLNYFPKEDITNQVYTSPEAMEYFHDAADLADSEPDIYLYNFLGYTGEFVFDNNMSDILLIPYQPLKIEPYCEENCGFKIIAPDGTIFLFMDVEFTLSRIIGSGHSEPDYSENAWYLSKIICVNGEIIDFEYETENYSYISGISESVDYITQTVYCGDNTVSASNSFPIVHYDHFNVINGKRLVSIKSNNPIDGSISFVYNVSDPDLNGYQHLNQILIETSDSITLEKINFDYLITNNNRTFLKDIHFLDVTKNYTFDYIDPLMLPPRLSFSQDHWGYFNNKPNNTLVPKPSNDPFYDRFTNAADRSPNFNEAKKGLLKKITYPTKGFTEIEYEPNTCYGTKIIPGQTGFAALSSINVDPGTTRDTVIIENIQNQYVQIYVNVRLYSSGEFCEGSQSTGHELCDLSILNMTTGNSVSLLQMTSSGLVPRDGNSFTLGSSSCYFYMAEGVNYRIILTSYGVCTEGSAHFNYVETEETTVEADVESGGCRVQKTTSYDLNNQNGEVTRYYYNKISDLGKSSGDPGLSPVYNFEKTTLLGCPNGAYEEVNHIILTANSILPLYYSGNSCTNYKYVTISQGGDNFENGAIQNEYIIHRDYPGNQILGLNMIYNAPWTNYGWDNGYLKHTKYYQKIGNGELLPVKEVINHYKSDPRYYKESYGYNIRKNYEFPLNSQNVTHICTAADTMESNMIWTCTTQHNHCLWIPSGKCFKLNAHNIQVPRCYAPCYGQHPGYTYTIPNIISNLDVLVYKNISIWNYKDSTITIDYDDHGTQAQKVVEEYSYDNLEHLQLTKTKSILNEENQILTKIYYPDDISSLNYLSGGSLTDEEFESLSLLKTGQTHRINEPIQKEKYVNSNLIETTRYNYYLINGIPMINNVQYSTLDNILEKRIEYSNYDANFNLIEFKKSSNATLSNIYGFNNRYIICQSKNSDYIECGYTSFENQELNGWEKPIANSFEDHEFFTGESSIKVTSGFGPGRDFYVGTLAGNHSGYQACVWVKGSKNAYLHIEANSYTIHQRVENEEETDGWHLLKVILYKNQYESLIDSNFKIKVYVGNDGSEPAYFDDLRFHPLDAQMITYTYKPLVGITSESDANNKPTRYEYDGFGRLTHVRDFQDNIIKKYDYHYKQ